MSLYPDYVTLEEGRDHLRITGETDTSDDAEIALAITAASRMIDKATNRQFGLDAAPTARVYTAHWDRARGYSVVSIDDVMTSTGMVVKSSSAADSTYDETHTDYHVLPLRAASEGKPWTLLTFPNGNYLSTQEGQVEVTARWGWTEVPASIKMATLIQMARLFKRRDAPFGVAGSAEMGSEMRLLSRLDPDVELLVSTYRRWWSAA